MIKRYCDMCDQQIDEGVHSWYVIELHGTDGEFRRKELCEECFASEINCSKKLNRCDTCRHWWKSEEVCLLDDCQYEPKTESQECYLKKSCDHYGDKQVCGRCREYNLYSHTKTEPFFRNPTEEEMKCVNDYIRSISKPTGVNIFDFMDEPQILKGGEDVHEFCKKCGESKARTIDGERYIVCEKASDAVCVTMKECPLGKWVCEKTYVVAPQI